MATVIDSAREITAKWYYKELWGWQLDKICTGKERPAFLKSLMIAANGDGILAPEERAWVIGRAAAGGAPDSLLKELESYAAKEDINEVVGSTLATNKSKRAVIYFAIKAAASDGEYHPDEQAAILKAATAMGISEDVVKQLEDLCAQEEKIKQERIALCFPDGDPFK
ncbi:MAG: TerB family tellurite resistance protein [Cyanobacteria bacterium P01_F01_bin.143]